MPASTIERTIAGPACSAAASPVSTKMPVPMIAPMPRVTRLTGPSTRLSEWSPVCAASAVNCSIDLVAKIDMEIRASRDARDYTLRGFGSPRGQQLRQTIDILAHTTFRVAGTEQVADHRD